MTVVRTYSIPVEFPNGFDLRALADGLAASSVGIIYVGASTSGDDLLLTFEVEPDASQDVAIAACMVSAGSSAEQLRSARELRFGQIDAKTDKIFATGFEFPGSGVRLSLSSEAQSRMIGLMIVRDSATYPIRWNALDDAAFVDLLDANDVITLFGAAAAALRSYVDGGTAIKNEVRTATTVAAVMAVVDPR